MSTPTPVWSIIWMNAYPQFDGQTDVVIQAGWACTVSQRINGALYEGISQGQSSFTLDSSTTFTPYDQLTQDQVLGWCWAATDPQGQVLIDKTVVEAQATARYEAQVTPPIVQPPLPWNPPDAPVVA